MSIWDKRENPILVDTDRRSGINYCEQCKNYWMIDSGFGQCTERLHLITVGVFKKRIYWVYPEVGWCSMACSKFIKRG